MLVRKAEKATRLRLLRSGNNRNPFYANLLLQTTCPRNMSSKPSCRIAMPSSSFRDHLLQNKATSLQTISFGVWASSCSPTVVEALSQAGFDWMLLDCEHAPRDLATCLYELRILEASPTFPLVRVAWNDAVLLKRVLDIGAENIMVPMVNSAQEAREAVRAVHYPPRGIRGAASGIRASHYGRDNKTYFPQANPFLIVQIETQEALGNLEAIAETGGVDAVFFGPTDLSADMGLLGQPAHPRVVETIGKAIASLQSNSPCHTGILSPGVDALEPFVATGADFVSVTSDLGMLLRAADKTLQEAKKQEAKKQEAKKVLKPL